MVEGSDQDIHGAESILSRRGIDDWGIYDGHKDDQRNYYPAGTLNKEGTVNPFAT